jgi:hypothetical protein
MTDQERTIVETFDNQARFDRRYLVHKELFVATRGFEIKDWKAIRTEKYWDNMARKDDFAQKQYTLECVEYYNRWNRSY